MTPVEIIAVIFAILVIVKMVTVWFVKPNFAMKMTKMFMSNRIIVTVGFVIVAAVIGYFLIAEMSISQIVAASLFGMIIYGLFIVQYPDEYLKLAADAMKNKTRVWLPSLIFLVLSLWVLYEAFM